MNTLPEYLPLAILLTVSVLTLVVSRLWLHRYHNTAQARSRLLGFSSVGLAVVFVGFAFISPSEPRTWASLALGFFTIILIERTRARLRKEVSNTDHHDA